MLTSFARRIATSRTTSALFSHRCFHASPLMLEKLTVEGLADRVNLEGENVLMRVDLNVPLSKEVGVVPLLCIILKSYSSRNPHDKR